MCEVHVHGLSLCLFHFSINTQVIMIITSTDKMAASGHFATVSEDDFVLKCFSFSLF